MCRKVFFYKQKTAYEMRISDWSSDVCSSDLGIDRAIETDVGRHIARDDRLWMPGGYRGAQRRSIAVDGLGRVEPVAVGLAVQRAGADGTRIRRRAARSEEHTSELQSLMRNSYAVFCLKNKKQLKQDST